MMSRRHMISPGALLGHTGKGCEELPDVETLGARVIERVRERDATGLQIAAKLGTRSPRPPLHAQGCRGAARSSVWEECSSVFSFLLSCLPLGEPEQEVVPCAL